MQISPRDLSLRECGWLAGGMNLGTHCLGITEPFEYFYTFERLLGKDLFDGIGGDPG